ncbi:Zinc finger CCCH domain-containing protein 1 [Tetrabaena socialis]|uniref:Zinc finger CCCH domain-containing protein 1 n=1 Tax=Tetrabaena socialis TaxID=47790 RepID=A0A2J8A146_9CHLO|nr:Zinc finger CCCH domain-containing protein 1 [Tetrabaena socialis]|eukprot:PNH06247.1 Zinc finger CCCH domain-containing protein 1 [Tetrabaena socialis]
MYKGTNAYIDYRKGFRREHTVAAEKGTGSHGPLRGSAYMRVTARFDYQPDVCKDYKETGYCSYGDACKFMHDRGDYKSGWELDKMWEEEQKKKADALARGWNPDEEEGEGAGGAVPEEEDELPFACFICRERWEDCKTPPVVTRCKHYFCEKCALKASSKANKCAVCGQSTQGIFNVAHDVLKRQRLAAAAEAAKHKQ